MSQEEITDLLKKSFPKEMIPHGYEVTEIKIEGYSNKEWSFSLEKKESIGEE